VAVTNGDLRQRFEDREVAVLAYATTWCFGPHEPHRSFLARRPDLRIRLLRAVAMGTFQLSTRDVYCADDYWERERSEMHDNLLWQLTQLCPDGSAVGPVYFTLGLPGSGKTSHLRPLALKHAAASDGRACVSDADEVRVLLREYADGLGSGVVQPETAVLTYGHAGYPGGEYPEGGGLQSRVLETGGVVIVDVIGHPSYLAETVTFIANSLRRPVYLLRTECALETCIERAMLRATSPGGRYIPAAVIQARVGQPEAALEAAVRTGHVDGWAVINTEHAVLGHADGDGTFEELVGVASPG
jgi:hypothetical protein